MGNRIIWFLFFTTAALCEIHYALCYIIVYFILYYIQLTTKFFQGKVIGQSDYRKYIFLILRYNRHKTLF